MISDKNMSQRKETRHKIIIKKCKERRNWRRRRYCKEEIRNKNKQKKKISSFS